MFSEEKVLYLAKENGRLHVNESEFNNKYGGTTLGKLVKRMEKDGKLNLWNKDCAGKYYKITLIGEIRLLMLQIEWRTRNRKNLGTRESQLRQLEQQLYQEKGIKPSYVPSKKKVNRKGEGRVFRDNPEFGAHSHVNVEELQGVLSVKVDDLLGEYEEKTANKDPNELF